jgi:hypothetical protein
MVSLLVCSHGCCLGDFKAAASAAELQILIISTDSTFFTDFLFAVCLTPFTVFDEILSFHGLTTAADILVRQDGRDTAVRRPRFCSQIIVSYFPN